MKKIIIAMFLFCASVNFAQNCKYDKNEIDPVTKKSLKITKTENLTGKLKFNENILRVAGAKTDAAILIFGLTIQSKLELNDIVAKKGYKAFLILEDNTNIELTNIADFKGSKFSEKNFSNFQYGVQPQYEVSNEQYLKLSGKEVKTVRIELDIDGNKTYKDTDINKSSKLEIGEVLKCVM